MMLWTGLCQLLMVGFHIVMLRNGPELIMSKKKDQRPYQVKGHILTAKPDRVFVRVTLEGGKPQF